MTDNENARKPHHSRKNPPYKDRPPPGVQKAMQNFGVKDLREILNKKHQDQEGESLDDKQPKEKLPPPPPPDPSYNYLRDPTRDRPKPPPPKKEEKKRPQETKDLQQHLRPRNEQTEHARQPRNKEQQQNNNSPQVKDDPKTVDKELHHQYPRGGRSGFRGRNSRRGQSGRPPREDREEKIENPANIKIQLSTKTGQRSCSLDESVRIADIKHVPDRENYLHRSPRGRRGGKGNYRGRGRGSFRGRSNRRGGDFDDDENEITSLSPKQTNSDSNESAAAEAPKDEGGQTHLAEYDDYEQENDDDEFVDSNDASATDEVPYENLMESERSLPKIEGSFDPNLAKTITITSSKFHDGEVKRSVEAKSTNGGNNKDDGTEKE